MSSQREALNKLIESMGGEDSDRWQDLPADELWALAWQAATEQAKPTGGGVPEGWQLVPIEPTEKMLDDGSEVPWLEIDDTQTRRLWANMLAATQQPKD